MKGSITWVRIGLFFLAHVTLVKSEKILFLIPMSTTSEKHVFDGVIHGLALDGHEVTVVTSSKSSNPFPNVTEIEPFTVQELFGEFSSPFDSGNTLRFTLSLIFLDMTNAAKMCHKVFESKEVEQILKVKYDLVFTNLLYGQCLYGIIYKNQSPFILLNSFPLPNYFLKDLGSYVPTSIVPYPITHYIDDMNFGQRLVNFVVDWSVYAYSELYYIPLFESVYRKHLGQEIPSVKEIHRNVSLVMTNTHFTSTYHRSIMPDLVEIGGIHCKRPKPLPKDLEEFVSGSSEGFIYFSFGTVLNASSFPLEVQKKFMNVLSKLKQRVLWKFETEDLDDLPSNVKLGKFFPQQDLLGHPKIRLFISHGGLLSTQQTIYHGIPVLYFPIFFDQITNVGNAVKQGYALSLDLWNFTEKDLLTSINRLLNEPQFSENAKKISSVFRDQMSNPMERVVFWTNFVLRHKGAPQLRSSGRNLNFIQFHSIDVVLFLGSFITAIILLTISLARRLWSLGFKVKLVKPKYD